MSSFENAASKSRNPVPEAALQASKLAHERRANRLAVGTLVLIWLPWLMATACPFIDIDDSEYVTHNAHVAGGLTLEHLHWAVTNLDVHFYLPATWISLMVDASMFGSGPRGFHLTNILLHLCNTLILYAFLRNTTKRTGRSFLVAALWCIHPLRVESVAWVTERKDVLSMFFGLGALWSYVRYVKSPRKILWYGAVVILLILSLLAKATFVTFPALLLLVDLWPLKRWQGAGTWKRLVLEKVPLFVLSLGAVAITVPGAADQAGYPLAQRLANAALSCAWYVRDTFYPLKLSLFYPMPPFTPPEEAGVGAGMIVLMITGAIWSWRARGKPEMVTGCFWFLGTLVPMSGLLQTGVQARADRFTYLPSIGLLIAIVWAWPAAWFTGRAQAQGRNIAVGALLLAMAWLTILRLAFWHDPLALYLDGIAQTEHNWYLEARVGDALSREGALDQAELFYRRSLNTCKDAATYNNLGSLLAKEKRFKEAAEAFQEAHEMDPSDPVMEANYRRVRAEQATSGS